MAVEAMLHSGPNHMALHRSWLSSIIKPGFGVLIGASADAWLCLHRNRWGCILWRLQGQRNGDLLCFVPIPFVAGQPSPWRLLHVQALATVRVMRLRGLPPCEMTGLSPEKPPPRGIVIALEGKIMTLVEHCAREAFRPLTVPQMDDLMGLLGYFWGKGKKPTKEIDIVEYLATRILGLEPGSQELKDILAKRNASKFEATADTESELLKTWSRQRRFSTPAT